MAFDHNFTNICVILVLFRSTYNNINMEGVECNCGVGAYDNVEWAWILMKSRGSYILKLMVLGCGG